MSINRQKGFIRIETSDIVIFLTIVALLGWGVGSILEYLWPFVKAAIHGATA